MEALQSTRAPKAWYAIWDDAAAVGATNLVDAEQFHRSASPYPRGRPRVTASTAASWMTTSTASAVAVGLASDVGPFDPQPTRSRVDCAAKPRLPPSAETWALHAHTTRPSHGEMSCTVYTL